MIDVMNTGVDGRQDRTRTQPTVVALGLVVAALLGGLLIGTNRDQGTETLTYGVTPQPPLPTRSPAAPFDPVTSIADHDGSTVVDLVGDRVRFTEETASGPATTEVDITSSDGELRAVAADGRQAAVFHRTGGDSVITVVPHSGGDTQTYTLPGLIEPEAFSTDGTLLYVIDHETDRGEGGYRVRPLNLASGQLEPTLGPTKQELVEVMNGRGRRQVWSPDGTRLYTLYIRQTHHHHDPTQSSGAQAQHIHAEPGTDAFVHVLDLEEEWAFCLDLPEAFGAGDLETTALAVSPDGNQVVVADRNAEQLAFASTEELKVTDTTVLPGVAVVGDLHIAVTADDLVLASGRQVHWFDRASFEPTSPDPSTVAGPVRGLTSTDTGVVAWTADGPLEVQAPTPT